MSLSQFGYYVSASSPLPPAAAPMSSSQHSPTSCCESGRPIMTDPHTGQTVCSCQVDSRLLSYPRLATGLPVGALYGSAYSDQGYVSFGADPSAFYSPLNNTYDLKDSSPGAWSSLTQAAAYYSYDPTMGAYPYSNGYGGVDLNGAARRKNATKEVTSTLKAWLYEHRKNPYPTKGEKIMLAIITKMTLTQVSTWFANARRRLKKENKMTWEPRNRVDDDDKSDIENDESKDGIESTVKDCKDETRGIKHRDMCDKAIDSDDMDGKGGGNMGGRLSLDADSRSSSPSSSLSLSSHTGGVSHSSLGGLSDPSPSPDLSALKSEHHGLHPHHHHHLMHHHHHLAGGGGNSINSGGSKPRIWSLAHTATSNSPPLCRRSTPPPLNPNPAGSIHQHPGLNSTSLGGGNPQSYLGGNGVSPYSAAALSAANKMSMAAAAHHHQAAVQSRPDLRTWIEGAFHGASALTAMGIAAQYHSLHAMQQQQQQQHQVMGHNGASGTQVNPSTGGALSASNHLSNLNMASALSVRSAIANGNPTTPVGMQSQQHQLPDSSVAAAMATNSMQGNGTPNALQCRLAPPSGSASGLKPGYPPSSCAASGVGSTNNNSMGTSVGQTSLIASIKTNLCSNSPGDRVGLHAGLSNVNRTSSQVEALSTAFRPVTKT